jgi:hypothetical protein
MSAEESRAIEFRRVLQARENDARARYKALAGDPAAKTALEAAFAPLLTQPEDTWTPAPRLADDERAVVGSTHEFPS